MTTNLVNVKVSHIRPRYNNLKEWMDDPNNVYIGRKGIVFIDGKRFPSKGSVFANPFKSAKEPGVDVIDKYRTYIIEQIESGAISEEEVTNLKGKTLGCWCRPERCHGDVLLEILDVWDEYLGEK